MQRFLVVFLIKLCYLIKLIFSLPFLPYNTPKRVSELNCTYLSLKERVKNLLLLFFLFKMFAEAAAGFMTSDRIANIEFSTVCKGYTMGSLNALQKIYVLY